LQHRGDHAVQVTPHLGRDRAHYPARMVGQVGRLSGIVGKNQMVEQRAPCCRCCRPCRLLPIALFKKEMPILLCRRQKRLAARVDKKNW